MAARKQIHILLIDLETKVGILEQNGREMKMHTDEAMQYAKALNETAHRYLQ